MCLYLPEHKGKSLDEQVAASLGMPDDLLEIRTLLHFNTPMGRDFLRRIAEAKGVPVDALARFEGEPLRAFYAKAVCGGVLLSLGASCDQPDRAAEVPMAFQSGLAGILLAAELVAHAAGLKPSAPALTAKVDLLRPLGNGRLSLPELKHGSGTCICQDSEYVAAYAAKYAVS